ncbi:Ig-like domain-containing protein [Rhabdothermincola salaria]|uniref:Ig-like domain-containing protein n=1 Tax=Rhabdothermincola salaria TaxID=2903142 RepID=UPI001E50E746|nr:Ig-like domain-containing protein [Rhabdothermincola salaria]MCD9622349.1 Ig-like domain-containing protein [Rhabdothermincola salaria]
MPRTLPPSAPTRRRLGVVAVAAALIAVVTAPFAGVAAAQTSTDDPRSESATTSTSSPSPDGSAAPANGEPWIISLGDSYISGEAGRWAGNTSTLPESANDALGPTAYFDNPTDTGELIPLCHRSKSAEVHIRDDGAATGLNTLNLACSGAQTNTYWSNGYLTDAFKPGIDFYDDGKGNKGQALMLQEFAAGEDVGLIVLSIGGNDFDVSGIATACVEDFLSSNVFATYTCHTDAAQRAKVSATAAEEVQGKIVGAIANIRTAMDAAGHAEGDYTLVVQTYPQPLPYGSNFRYSESGYTRQTTGGCGFWDTDANWMVNDVLGVVNSTVRAAVAEAGGDIVTLELSPLLTGRRLCETGVDQLQAGGVTSWTQADAVDRTEWVNMIYINTAGTSHFQQESLHPDYWAQLALRNCLTQVWNDGDPRSGTCVRGTGKNADGEPNVILQDQLVTVRPQSSADRFDVVGATDVPAPGVLANDTGTDPVLLGAAGAADGPHAVAEGDDLRLVVPADGITARMVDPPAHGTLELRSDGSFTYRPADGFVGDDRFTYVAADHYGTGEVTTVVLAVGAGATPATAPLVPAFTG